MINKFGRLLAIPIFAFCFVIKSEVPLIKNEKKLTNLINKQKTKPVVATLKTATCPYCNNLTPLIEKIAKELEGKAIFVQINVHETPEIAQKHKVGSVPTTLVFKPKNPQSPEKITGQATDHIEKIKKAINSAIPKRSMPENETTSEEKVKHEEKPAQKGLITVQNKQEFDNQLSKGKPVLALVSMKTCGPCKMIKGPFNKLAEENSDAIFLYIDKDQVPQVNQQFSSDIKGYPTFLFFKDGKKVQAFTGASERGLTAKVASFLGKQSEFQTVRMEVPEASNRPNQPQMVQQDEVKTVKKYKSGRRKLY